ncbi:MAG: nicotinate phosphoribosyltransferase [Treponema sp.]|nr:nicotinate phosphoribosyltransferase [Treponema sp.]
MDFYSLTMAQGYWKRGMNKHSVFEMYFRNQPFGGGFSIFAGLGTLLEGLQTLNFSDTDIDYIKSLGSFEDAFLEYLKGFKFSGSVWAMEEGSVVFPNEPLIRVEGGLIECQLIEGMLLNTINFQSLIATKTARVVLAASKGSAAGTVVEFGLRRAQGPDGALSASRAAYIGGAAGTSNALAGKEFGIPLMGTMAHSWIMAFSDEEQAFRNYAELYPDSSTFLIDTYDTLKSGIVNAIKVGKELKTAGKNFGVRLDSGDIHYLSIEVRKRLDEAGLDKAFITVSNDLDESIIKTLSDVGVPIDVWGVGTKMITGGTEAAFSGIYKLAASEDENGKLLSKMKFSDNPEKTTNPGIKQVWRIRDREGMYVADVLGLEGPGESDRFENGKTYLFWHPSADYRRFSCNLDSGIEALLMEQLREGKPLGKQPSLKEIRDRTIRNLESLDQSYKRFLNPHIYKVSITERLRDLKLELIKSHVGEL